MRVIAAGGRAGRTGVSSTMRQHRLPGPGLLRRGKGDEILLVHRNDMVDVANDGDGCLSEEG